jgi:hypothetical protein
MRRARKSVFHNRHELFEQLYGVRHVAGEHIQAFIGMPLIILLSDRSPKVDCTNH